MENPRLHVLLIVLLMHCFMCSFGLAFKNLDTDKAALLQFKTSILDPNNVLAKNWSIAASTCNWVGVSCGRSHERVVALRLPNMDLKGNIPPCIGNLSFLDALNLSFNRFHGSLPKEMEQMKRLRVIDLGSNFLSGRLPIWSGSIHRIELLALRNNSFTGTISRLLFNMSRLEILSISNNFLRGTIPNEIGNLKNLRILQLGQNQLSGSLPSTIQNMSSLQVLSMSYNELSGHIPSNLGECKQLQVISLSFNKFDGNIPTSLTNLTILKRLYLGTNKLKGEIPFGFDILQDLEILNASNMNLSGHIPPSIFNASSLKELYLQNNSLTGEIPVRFQVPNLETLFLWGNSLSGIIPSSIGNCSELRNLELEQNILSGVIPNTLGNLRFLEWLTISKNNLTADGGILSSLSNCKNLKHLGISHNPLNGILLNSMGNLSSSLQAFYASNCTLRGNIIPVEIGKFSNLMILSLYDNHLAGTIPATVGKLQNLQALVLHGNKLQGPIPLNICHLRRLNLISFSRNVLNGTLPTCIANLTSLRYLYLDSNHLSSTIPPSLWSLNYILGVNLASNSFSGILPPEVGNLKVITYLDLSRNILSGDIPSTLGGLQNLQLLSLANNRFQGSIPNAFGMMISLISLDLSGNNLSGVIPKALEGISTLKFFNVSSNRLEGEIPNQGPFVNFSAKSFMENYALCGLPRLLVPPCKTKATHRSKKRNIHVLIYILPPVAFAVLIVVLLIFLRRHKKSKETFPDEENLLPLATLRRISHAELLQATDGLSECYVIGSGSFGCVYKGILTDGTNVAVKVFNMQLEETFRTFEVECEVLCNIRHRNLVKIIGSCSKENFKALVFQFIPNGSLEKWLYSHNYCLDILQRLDIMIDVASALEYLHYGHPTPIVHCDLKPSNVLLDEDMVAHVTDFGISKLLRDDNSVIQTMTLATIGYMAPEYGTTGLVSVKGDVYSYGVLLMETFTRKKPTDEMFEGEKSLQNWVKEALSDDRITDVIDANMSRTHEEHFSTKENCLSSLMQLALDCTAESPRERDNMNDIVAKLKKIKIKYVGGPKP